MNPSPSRHPAFIAIACLSLLAAWSTPEAEVVSLDHPRGGLALVEAMPPTVRAPASLEADCIAHAGAQRALCVYAGTRQVDPAGSNAMTAHAQTGKAVPTEQRLVTHNAVADSRRSAPRGFSADRARSERFVLVH